LVVYNDKDEKARQPIRFLRFFSLMSSAHHFSPTIGEPDLADHDSMSPAPGAIVRDQDRLLPTANITRIMKRALPVNAKIAKDAKDTMQESVSEFIMFITSEASEKCVNEKRKTINGEDIIWAMQQLGFDMYVEPLKLYLQKYREMPMNMQAGEKPVKRSSSGQQLANKKDSSPMLESSQQLMHRDLAAGLYQTSFPLSSAFQLPQTLHALGPSGQSYGDPDAE